MSIPLDSNFMIPGLAKAIKTVAAAFIPGVFIKRSIQRPNKNEENNNSQPGVVKGRNNTNIT
jgi:hypothetical protein